MSELVVKVLCGGRRRGGLLTQHVAPVALWY